MIEINGMNGSTSPVRNTINKQEVSYENLYVLNQQENNEPEDKHTFINDNRTKFFLSMLMHLFIQISFISLLEPLLFFNYISNVEKDMFYNELSSLSTSNEIYTDSDIIRNEIFYSYMIQYIEDNNIYIDPFYNNLELLSQQELDNLSHTKNKLQYKAYHFTIISWCLMFIYLPFFKYLYPKKKIIKYFSHHIILIMMIGLYEIWLFKNIILKYVPWSKAEIELYIFKCFWAKTMSYYPELECMENNVTISC